MLKEKSSQKGISNCRAKHTHTQEQEEKQHRERVWSTPVACVRLTVDIGPVYRRLTGRLRGASVRGH